MKKRLAIWGIEKREGWQTESEEEKRERKFRGVGFSCFSFLSKGVTKENILTGEGGFLFVKLGESTERVRLVLRVLFSPWKRKVGVPWASVVLLFPYIYMYLYLLI